jgi:tetratricopeptide (TPR) repeat protein
MSDEENQEPIEEQAAPEGGEDRAPTESGDHGEDLASPETDIAETGDREDTPLVEDPGEEVADEAADRIDAEDDPVPEAATVIAALPDTGESPEATRDSSPEESKPQQHKSRQGSGKKRKKKKKKPSESSADTTVELVDPEFTPQQLKASEVERRAREEQEEAMSTVKEYSKLAVIAVAGVLVVTAGLGYVKNQKATVRSNAARLFSEAETPEQFQEVVDTYGKTSTAPFALSASAKRHFDKGEYQKAYDAYDRVLRDYPDFEFAAGAVYGKNFCLEALGEIEKAIEGWDGYLAVHEKYFLTPSAVLAKARCLVHLQRYRDARTTYEDFIADNPGTSWSAQAQDLLAKIATK